MKGVGGLLSFRWVGEDLMYLFGTLYVKCSLVMKSSGIVDAGERSDTKRVKCILL